MSNSLLFPVTYKTTLHFADEVGRLRELGVQAFVIGVPWDMIAPHEDQAAVNYGYSLRALAQRGGLTAPQVVAILQDKRPEQVYEPGNQPHHQRVLFNMMRDWEDAQSRR